MQLGFVIDQSRCIGCHACTVACKSENSVPLGNFRTWVKYTEQGEFPTVKRSFAVLRCNQCSDAPCVKICPVAALDKRDDGIVDIDPARCIGCKSCTHACPYDAIYLNEATGTVEKCHFCAHRVEQGLAPACAVVCPTEAIIPGDFHDKTSRVFQLKQEHDLVGRRTEVGTRPNVLYRDVSPAGIEPAASNAAGGLLWANQLPSASMQAQAFEAGIAPPPARTVYDVPRASTWGRFITAYLFFKSLAAGIFGVGALSFAAQDILSAHAAPLAWMSMVCLAVTSILLIADLKRPERFWFLLAKPNWSSWLVRGTVFLIVYGGCLSVWIAAPWLGITLSSTVEQALLGGSVVMGGLAAAYTGWLFAQAKGRVLWMARGTWLHLLVQASVAGSAALLLSNALWPSLLDKTADTVRLVLIGSLLAHAVWLAIEGRLAPPRREAEFARAHRLLTHGPWAREHWLWGVAIGIVLPLGLLVLATSLPPVVGVVAGGTALLGLWTEEDLFVRVGQALPIS